MSAVPLQRIALSTGVALDVAVAGDAAHPPMIFLHGFPESHRTWRHQLAEFARDHFVIAPDQRGYARSDKPADVADYATDKLLADVLALADHFAINRFTLVGHDWGGAVAWMAAINRADRVARLVISIRRIRSSFSAACSMTRTSAGQANISALFATPRLRRTSPGLAWKPISTRPLSVMPTPKSWRRSAPPMSINGRSPAR